MNSSKSHYAFAVFIILFFWTTHINAQPITIKLPHSSAENTPKGQMANRFRELIAERLRGRVEIEVYPSNQLFGDNKVMEAMLLGDVQMAILSTNKFSRSKLQIFDIPFRFENISDVEHFQNSGDGQNLLQSFTNRGLIGLGFLNYGMRQILSRDYLNAPSSAKEVLSIINPNGKNSRGSTWSGINVNYYRNNSELTNITISNHNVQSFIIFTSDEFWLSLPHDIRQEVKSALDEAIGFGNEVAAQKIMYDRQKIVESGRFVIRNLSNTDRNEWINAMRPIFQEYESADWISSFCETCTATPETCANMACSQGLQCCNGVCKTSCN